MNILQLLQKNVVQSMSLQCFRKVPEESDIFWPQQSKMSLWNHKIYEKSKNDAEFFILVSELTFLLP